MDVNKIYHGDALETLKTFSDESVSCVVTSPPYWALRDYGVKGQLGLEPTFEEHIDKMCDMFDEVKRVLRKDGTCWVNYGDTYFNQSSYSEKGRQGFGKDKIGMMFKKGNLPTKSLTMIPFRFAIEMVNRGWILRNTIIWHKPNPMPSSAKDRFTVDFEYLFFFSKSKKYWFEQQFEKSKDPEDDIRRMMKSKDYSSDRQGGNAAFYQKQRNIAKVKNRMMQGRNTRAVWKIPTQPFPEAHFAVYPEKLCRIPIKAGCPEFICKKCGKAREKILEPSKEYKKHLGKSWHDHKRDEVEGNIKRGKSLRAEYDVKGLTNCGCKAGFRKGIVLDPFMGSGTTAVVARKLGRDYLGIELNPKYIKIAEKRLQQQMLI